jgi:transposase
MLQRHLPNGMTFFAHRLTNAVTEGLNSKIQTIKKMALRLPEPRALQDRHLFPLRGS